MPARPKPTIEAICAAAAVVEYIAHPTQPGLVVRPTGDKSPAQLRVGAN